ncbi:Annexin A2 [Thelohanellus kitauei]|uniref:Annexin A2 n=1 Tax=Thelohanellus kitauei TaxID=669202 RepID=A0A0C2NC03_THEKT|nr:Annexin A2 [Thelohanellus kitauei]
MSQQAPAAPIPSLRPTEKMSIETAVNILRNNLMSSNADEMAIYNVLAHSTLQLRGYIRAEYKRTSMNELTTDLMSRFRQESQYFIYGLLNTGAEFDAFILYKATEFTFNHELVIHIFSTRTHEQLLSIRASLQRLFRVDLGRLIKMRTSGNYRKLLTFLMKNPRDLGGPKIYEIDRDRDIIKQGSHELFGVSMNLIPLFAKSSIPHIQAVVASYENVKINLSDIQRKCMGEYSAALKSLCHCILNPTSYFADFLKRNIYYAQIEAIIIVACTRCEYDLGSISNCYTAKYGTNLAQDIYNRFCGQHPAIAEGILMLLGMK